MSQRKSSPDPATQNLWVYATRIEESERGNVWTKDYGIIKLPAGWEFLGSGDAFLTRTVKKLGPWWLLCKNDRKRRFTRKLGIYAPAENVRKAQEFAQQTQEERQKKRVCGARSRDKSEERYREEFRAAALKFLNFDPAHATAALEIATAVAERACAVGSGRVGRTSTLPLEEKVRLAVRAHLRHNITGYDDALFERAMADESIEVPDEDRRELQRAAGRQIDEYLRRMRRMSETPDADSENV